MTQQKSEYDMSLSNASNHVTPAESMPHNKSILKFYTLTAIFQVSLKNSKDSDQLLRMPTYTYKSSSSQRYIHKKA